MNCEKSILSTSLFNDTLSDTEILEQLKEMKRKKEIVQKYGNKIKQRKDDTRYYVYIDRKQYIANSYDELIQQLYTKFYGKFNYSLEELYPEWIRWKRDYSATTSKTLKEYAGIWKNTMEKQDIISIPVTKLRTIDFVNLFRKLTKDRTMTKKAFNNLKSLLNGIMRYAIEQEIIQINPIDNVDTKQFTFKPVNNSNDVFTISDRDKLLEHLKNNQNIYALAIRLDFHLVARIGELLALRWSDIEGDYIHIQGQCVREMKMNDDLSFSRRTYENVNHVKGYADEGFRYMPITPECRNILDEIRKLNPDGEFILMQNGKQLLADTFNEYLKKYCLECNIKPRSSHKVRFTVASILYNKGVPLQSLQKLLGHTTTAMTLHYLRQVTPMDETVDIMRMALG